MKKIEFLKISNKPKIGLGDLRSKLYSLSKDIYVFRTQFIFLTTKIGGTAQTEQVPAVAFYQLGAVGSATQNPYLVLCITLQNLFQTQPTQITCQKQATAILGSQLTSTQLLKTDAPIYQNTEDPNTIRVVLADNMNLRAYTANFSTSNPKLELVKTVSLFSRSNSISPLIEVKPTQLFIKYNSPSASNPFRSTYRCFAAKNGTFEANCQPQVPISLNDVFYVGPPDIEGNVSRSMVEIPAYVEYDQILDFLVNSEMA